MSTTDKFIALTIMSVGERSVSAEALEVFMREAVKHAREEVVEKIVKNMPWRVKLCKCKEARRSPTEEAHCNQEGRYSALCEVRDYLESLQSLK